MCSPSFPCAGSALSKPQSTMEPFCSKREQEGGWIRKYFILGIFFFPTEPCHIQVPPLLYGHVPVPLCKDQPCCCPCVRVSVHVSQAGLWSCLESAEAVPMAVGYSSTDRLLQWVMYCLLGPGDGIQTSQPFIIHKWKSGT